MILAYLTRTWQTLVAAVAACALCYILGQCDGKATGRKLERAEWQAASDRIKSAALRIQNATDTIAKERERQIITQDEDLRNAASKGTDEPVGAGVRGVLNELRRQQGRRAD